MKKLAVVLLMLYAMLVAFSSRAEFVTVTGHIANSGGTEVQIHFTDGDSINNMIAVSDSLGLYSVVVTTSDSVGFLYVYFINCNGGVNDTIIAFYNNMPPIIFNADYCPSAGTTACLAEFTLIQTADSSYTLEIDSTTWQNSYSFQWDFGDGNMSTEYFPTHTYDNTGNYNLCMTITEADGQTCSYCDTVHVTQSGLIVSAVAYSFVTVNSSTTSITTFELYPNPANDLVRLHFVTKQSADFDLTIHDTSGKEVIKKSFKTLSGKNDVSLPIDVLRSGIYVVAISNTSHEVVSRVLIKK